jgi:unsaturated rhamnogalacturonyl hydrolase
VVRASLVTAVAALLLGAEPCGGGGLPSASNGLPPAQEDAGAPPRACTQTPRAAGDAFAVERAPASEAIATARAVADRWMTEHPPERLEWSWGEGTVVGALVELYRVTLDARYLDYARRFIDHNIAQGFIVTTSDKCPPVLAALELFASTCGAQYGRVIDRFETYLYAEALRTDDGGVSHLGTLPIFGKTLWLDSLYMFGTPLVRLAETQGSTRALDEYSSQFKIFQGHLQDASGLFVHAYQWTGPQDPGVFWARGNGWVLASGYDYLRVRKLRGERDDAVAASLGRLAAAVIEKQDPATGLFWTVVNRPGETYLETSAAALFALGLARGYRAGAQDRAVLPVIARAVAGIRARLVNDAQGRPVVTGVSGPTDVGTFSYYQGVKQADDLSYGVGAVILALIETSGLE